MSFALIAAEKAHHSVSQMARVLGVSRAGYYAWAARGPSLRRQADETLTARVTAIHAATRDIYRAPRIHAELAQAQGVHVGRKRVARLMRASGLSGVSRRRGVRTTTPGRERPSAPNLVERDFTATAPDELWSPTSPACSTGS